MNDASQQTPLDNDIPVHLATDPLMIPGSFFRVFARPKDLNLAIGYLKPLDDQRLVIEEKVLVTMSWPMVFELAEHLRRAIDGYERAATLALAHERVSDA